MYNRAPWMIVAEKELGVVEPEAMKYFSATDYPSKWLNSKTPYCAAFANWCLKKTGIKGARLGLPKKLLSMALEKLGIQGSGHADAMSFAKWGKDVSKEKPFGCIVVFKWSTGGHHVAFNYGEGKFLGGNQTSKHKVCIESLPINRAIAWRMPA